MTSPRDSHRQGILLVLAAACVWSSGGLLARQIEADPWTVIAWRGLFAAAALLLFLLLRDGRETPALFRALGLSGLIVALCIAAASTGFVMALSYASVALVLTVQASTPLIAALIARIWLREPIGWPRALAMAVAFAGIALMAGKAEEQNRWPGILLALMVALVFALGTVLMRRHRHIRMTPASCLAAILISLLGFALSPDPAVGWPDLGFLFLFGAGQLGLGLIFFTIGARHLPAAQATLLALLETVLGTLWALLFLGETPGLTALYGGIAVVAAVAASAIYDQRRAARLPLGAA